MPDGRTDVAFNAPFVSLLNFLSGGECGFPGLPLNGSLVGSSMLFEQGEDAAYSCDEGFVLFGEDKRTCLQNGTWSGLVPECSE